MLTLCKFCGKTNCEPHKKYVDRCVECGKRYTKYSNYKSLQKTSPSFKRAHKLEEIILEYRELQRHGYKVPHDLK